jgi:hypothetical protein
MYEEIEKIIERNANVIFRECYQRILVFWDATEKFRLYVVFFKHNIRGNGLFLLSPPTPMLWLAAPSLQNGIFKMFDISF